MEFTPSAERLVSRAGAFAHRVCGKASAASVFLAALALFLVACATPDAPVLAPPADPMENADYRDSLERLKSLNTEAKAHWDQGHHDQAAAVVKEAQPIATKLLEARRPPLQVFEAVSDFDMLYGRILLSNRHTVWARQIFMTNVVRWRTWKPETEDTIRRRKEAEAAVAECDRQMNLNPLLLRNGNERATPP